MLLKWGEHAGDVQFILQRTSLDCQTAINRAATQLQQSPKTNISFTNNHTQQIDVKSQYYPSAHDNFNSSVSPNLSPPNSHKSQLSSSHHRDIKKSLTFSGGVLVSGDEGQHKRMQQVGSECDSHYGFGVSNSHHSRQHSFDNLHSEPSYILIPTAQHYPNSCQQAHSDPCPASYTKHSPSKASVTKTVINQSPCAQSNNPLHNIPVTHNYNHSGKDGRKNDVASPSLCNGKTNTRPPVPPPYELAARGIPPPPFLSNGAFVRGHGYSEASIQSLYSSPSMDCSNYGSRLPHAKSPCQTHNSSTATAVSSASSCNHISASLSAGELQKSPTAVRPEIPARQLPPYRPPPPPPASVFHPPKFGGAFTSPSQVPSTSQQTYSSVRSITTPPFASQQSNFSPIKSKHNIEKNINLDKSPKQSDHPNSNISSAILASNNRLTFSNSDSQLLLPSNQKFNTVGQDLTFHIADPKTISNSSSTSSVVSLAMFARTSDECVANTSSAPKHVNNSVPAPTHPSTDKVRVHLCLLLI